MGLFDMGKRKDEGSDEYIEVGSEIYDVKSELTDKVKIEMFTLDKYDDIRKVTSAYTEGNVICLVNIGRLVDLEFGEPHMAVKKMKQTVEKVGGDIAAIKGNWIVMTPAFATIHRKSKEFENIKEAISDELD